MLPNLVVRKTHELQSKNEEWRPKKRPALHSDPATAAKVLRALERKVAKSVPPTSVTEEQTEYLTTPNSSRSHSTPATQFTAVMQPPSGFTAFVVQMDGASTPLDLIVPVTAVTSAVSTTVPASLP